MGEKSLIIYLISAATCSVPMKYVLEEKNVEHIRNKLLSSTSIEWMYTFCLWNIYQQTACYRSHCHMYVYHPLQSHLAYFLAIYSIAPYHMCINRMRMSHLTFPFRCFECGKSIKKNKKINKEKITELSPPIIISLNI